MNQRNPKNEINDHLCIVGKLIPPLLHKVPLDSEDIRQLAECRSNNQRLMAILKHIPTMAEHLNELKGTQIVLNKLLSPYDPELKPRSAPTLGM